MQDHLTIGRIARDAGTGVETARFYERQGLLAKPARLSASPHAEIVAIQLL